MKFQPIIATFALLLSSLVLAANQGKPHAYIISPSDGETVTSPVLVQFGLENYGVAPAGVKHANTGHHHLLVDVDHLPDLDKPIPSDEHHIHFGGGQTQTRLNLAPGTHTLQLLLGDYRHVPGNPPIVSQPITIHVK